MGAGVRRQPGCVTCASAAGLHCAKAQVVRERKLTWGGLEAVQKFQRLPSATLQEIGSVTEVSVMLVFRRVSVLQ